MKMLFSLLALSLGLLLVAFLLIFFFQRQILYPSPPVSLPATLPDNVSKLEFAAGYGLLLKSETGSSQKQPLLIFAHGNGEAAFHWIDEFRPLTQMGLAVLLVEYPGYAGAAGQPSLQSIERMMLAAYDTVRDRPDINGNKIIAYGRSIGGGAATLLAAQRPLAALCLESSFSSLAELVAEKGMPSFLLRDRYDNLSVVKNLDMPVFLYHGEYDSLIPVSHSLALQRVAHDGRLITAKCGHNDCPRPWRELQEFLSKI